MLEPRVRGPGQSIELGGYVGCPPALAFHWSHSRWQRIPASKEGREITASRIRSPPPPPNTDHDKDLRKRKSQERIKEQ